MRVLVLGASGFVGRPVTRELISSGYQVTALARSAATARSLEELGADVVEGDIRNPAVWSSVLADVDAVAHMAATFTEDMGDVDRHLIETMIAASKGQPTKPFLYTGGTWLYGETGDVAATEETAMNPIPSFAWMVRNAELLKSATCFKTIIIHPAMVYDREGGAVGRFVEEAQGGSRIEVWGSPSTRWPVVHRDDLATAYRLALEKGVTGESYNIAAETGVNVGAIASAIGRRFDLPVEPSFLPPEDVIAREGEWALGPTLDQRLDSDKARVQLGWQPRITDILSEVG